MTMWDLELGISDAEQESLATPFETWCESAGLHPEDIDAWTLYQLDRIVTHAA
jgi:hypothetical protein